MITCPKCSQQCNDGSDFCGQCGTQLLKTIFCPKCGKQIDTKFAFCPDCGAPLIRKDKPCTKKKLPNRKVMVAILCALFAVAAFVVILNNIIIPNTKYNKAVKLIDSGDYMSSYLLFREIYGYRDSKDYLSHFKICYDEKYYTISTPTIITTSVSKYTYDSKGNVVKEVYMGHDGNVTQINEYVYDSDGNLVKKIDIFSDGTKETSEYTYDIKGNMAKEIEKDADGNIWCSTRYSYDNNGYLLKKLKSVQLSQKIVTYNY